MTALEARWGQFVCAVAERDAAIAEVQGIHVERDEAIRLAETREAARIRTVFQAAKQATEFDHREQELIRQVEGLQLDVHHLNNMVNPILPPNAPVVEEDPNVLIAEDDGMEVDAKDEPKDEEIKPFEDDQGDGVSDVDNNHPEELLSFSIQLDALALYLQSFM